MHAGCLISLPCTGEEQDGLDESPSPGLENHDPQKPKVDTIMPKKLSAGHGLDDLASRDGEQQGGQLQVAGMDTHDDGFHDALEIMANSSVSGVPHPLDFRPNVYHACMHTESCPGMP